MLIKFLKDSIAHTNTFGIQPPTLTMLSQYSFVFPILHLQWNSPHIDLYLTPGKIYKNRTQAQQVSSTQSCTIQPPHPQSHSWHQHHALTSILDNLHHLPSIHLPPFTHKHPRTQNSGRFQNFQNPFSSVIYLHLPSTHHTSLHQ